MPGHRLYFIVENPKERMEYVRFFENLGFLTEASPDGSDTAAYLNEKKPDVIIADLQTPGFSAAECLKQIGESDISCQVLMITSEPVVEQAVSLMKLGAFDYLIKPMDAEQLDLSIRRAIDLLRKKTDSVLVQNTSHARKIKIITQDTQVQKLLSLAERIAKSSASVLIQGESGTGKELFARYIHEKSDRHNKPFVAVNCAALPENLLESELFGHEKGAFTGAISRKTGKFELAHKGTLFLDEITEMQVHLQAKLLRVIQEKILDRVGGIEPVEIDVRIIATTNRDVKEAMENGDFRSDLFYRLNTIPIVIPPLRNRKGDVDILAKYFIQKYCKIDGRHVKGLTKQAGSILSSHSFPGNVRELENIIHRAVLLADSDLIEAGNLMMDISEDTIGIPEPDDSDTVESVPGSLRDMEQKMIYRALDQTDGNRTHAAKILGISVRTLRNKLHEYKENY